MAKKRKSGFRLLKLKLVAGAAEQLDKIGEMCRKARNAALEDWLLRQRGKPASEKQRDGLSESTKIYHAVTAAVPELATRSVASMLAQQIYSSLNAKVDWRRGKSADGEQPRRKDAILNYEDRPPFSSSVEIPVCAATSAIKYGPWSGIKVQLLRGEHIELPFITDKLPQAFRLILTRITGGELKLQDSRLVRKQDLKTGEWNWYLFVPVKVEAMPAADPEREMILWPNQPADEQEAKNDRPFSVRGPESEKDWRLGDGRYYYAQCERLVRILKEIGWQYRQRNGTGHGRQKYDHAKRLREKQIRNIADEFRRKTICKIIEQMERQQCGTLVYREPSLPLRKRCWFERRGVLWDWTRFLTDLENALARRGYVLTKKPLKWKEAQGGAA